MAANWSLKGTYFESCNCDILCPCIFAKTPTKGYCQALAAWRIDDGHMDDVRLDGLIVAAWLHAPTNLLDGQWRMALYLDDKANDAQKEALTQIYTGQVGGQPAVLGGFIAEVMGIKSVPIELEVEGRHGTLRIPDIGEGEIETIADEAGNEVTIHNAPLAICPGVPLVIAKTKRVRYHDHGVDQLDSATNGFTANFSYQP